MFGINFASLSIMEMKFELENVVNLIWVLAILPFVIASLPCLGSLHHLILLFVGRGKIFHSSPLFNKLTVPQQFFAHFYIFAVVWNSVLLLTTWVYAHSIGSNISESTAHSNVASYLTGGSHLFSPDNAQSTSPDYIFRVWRSVFLLILLEVQVLCRLYESIYVFTYSSTARMNIFGYLLTFIYYTEAPLSLACDCAIEAFTFVANRGAEFIVKGKDRMPPLEIHLLDYVSPLLKLGWLQLIGAVIFFYGWIHQRRCHIILGNLRKGKEQANDYRIPYGDWFEIVSSPHFFAEIVIYSGFVVATGGSQLSVWLLFAFVVANLAFAAAETQRWYQRKFDNYPSNRYVIVPFLY